MLPQETENKVLNQPHFPTLYQALIFRLWDMVSYKKIAEIIETTPENVLKSASLMGLGEQKHLDKWMERGYISIIKQVWNLLPYSQMLKLLDWSEERLEFILKEDDFLKGKLGEKCHCEAVLYRELTKEEAEKTENIKKTVEAEIAPLEKEEKAIPFDFFTSTYQSIIPPQEKEIKIDSSWSIVYNKDNPLICDYVEDFKAFAKKYNVCFCENSQKQIILNETLPFEDEEHHQVEINKDFVKISASSPLGILRGLYFVEDLAESVSSFTFEEKLYNRKTKMKTRFIYSFCGLYTDVLDKDSKISFPDELLQGYARRGINGVWIQGVLSKLAPYPFDESLCKGWETRLENLDKLIKRAARYGIKVYMYINEPRSLPTSFYENHQELKGATLVDGMTCLCTSHEATHKYLKEAIQTVCRRVPDLGGFLNITQTENRVLCWSQGYHITKDQECPVCSKKAPSEVIASAIKTMANAVEEINKDIKYIYFAWSLDHTIGTEETEKLIMSLPKNVIVLQVSETQIPLNIGGCKDELLDYSLAIVGPGECAKTIWNNAKKAGLETAAKVQINNSWECSTAPFLPVYDNVIEHITNLADEGVEHIMLSWTLGGYMSDNIKIASSYFFEDTNSSEDIYDRILSQTYGKYKNIVKESAYYFTKGFKEYPFNWAHIYFGPSNAGVANLLYPTKSNMTATMTCYPYDDLKTWCGISAFNPNDTEHPVYPPEVLENQYSLICKDWEKGLEIVKELPLCEFKDMAYYGYTLFKSSLNQISFYIQRNGEQNKEVMRKIVENEKELAKIVYEIMLRNSAVGYEAANHYYITRSMIQEKIVQCDYLLDNIY